MLTEAEKTEINKHSEDLSKLPAPLFEKLKKAIKSGQSPFERADGDICCDTGTDAGTRYQKCSRDTCVSLGWTVVADSNCS
jgi:hypothetical protein